MSESIIIRKAEIEDVTSVKNIELECTLSTWQIADYQNEVSREDSIFIIAEINKKIVGYLLSRLIMNSNSSPKYYLEDT